MSVSKSARLNETDRVIMKDVTLYTDGACKGNPGPGGYGAVLIFGKHRNELSGGFRMTTNNRMELLAVIKGLEVLKEKCRVSLWSDSNVLEALSKGSAARWRANGWRRNKNKSAVNPDLWGTLLDLCEFHDVTYNWVRGHSGHAENERCDQLATEASSQSDLPTDEEYEATHVTTQQTTNNEFPVAAESPPVGMAQRVRIGLTSEDSRRRRDSIFRIVEERLTELGPDLIQLMDSDPDPGLKGRCAWALGRLNYRDARPHLTRNLEQPRQELRRWSAWALGELGDHRAETPLRRVLEREKSDQVRQVIGGALRKLGFESTRVHKGQLEKQLRPPETSDSVLTLLIERLEQFEWPVDSEQIADARAKMKHHNPEYFALYMKWVERKPGIIAALRDRSKVFDD